MFTDGSGIENTTILLIWVWAAFMAIGAIVLRRSICLYARPQTPFLIVLSVVIGPIVATLTLFPIIYTLMSVPRQQMFELSYWQHEIATGTLALRVTSILLTYQLARAIVRFVPRRRELVSAREARGLSHDDVADFTSTVTIEERRLWKRNDLVSLAFFQFSFYLIALSAMWGCTIAGVHTLFTALASWALLFIVDDWSVIADYCQRFDSLPIPTHAVKVLCVDMILLVAVPAALYQAKLGAFWVAISLAMFVSGLFVVMFFWRALHFGVQDA